MSLDAAVAAAIQRAIDQTVRAERDRLARILRDHGHARIARDVECCDDEGAGPGECYACRGVGERGGFDASRGLWTEPCDACGGTGRHAPRVTA